MLTVLIVEDSERLQPALVAGLNATAKVQVLQAVSNGEAALETCTAGDELPDVVLMVVLDFSSTLRMFGIPVMLLLFPPYAILCVLLPLHAIQHPAPPRYEFSYLARQRARPWLVRASALLLVVSVVVAGFIVYMIGAAQDARQANLGDGLFSLPLILFDLGATGIIAVVIVSLGQAVTVYEIFTGKTLQRRRMTEQRVMDFRTRRALHDRSLPALHEAILSLSTSTDPAAPEMISTLSRIHKELSNTIRTAPDMPVNEEANDFLGLLRNELQDEFAREFEQIDWQLPDRVKAVDGLTADILYGAIREAVRNAALHARGDNPKRALCLWIAVQETDTLCVTIRDNGIGPNAEPKPRGGSGLALHGTLMALMGGSLSIETAHEGGTLVRLVGGRERNA